MSDPKRKNNYQNRQSKQRKHSFLEPGLKGFVATCNFREKECIRECYNILNQYSETPVLETPPTDNVTHDDDEADEDISKALEKDVAAEKMKNQKKSQKFSVADTGVTNCVFIATTLEDPAQLGIRIVRDIAETKVQKTKFLLRLIPVEAVCRANVKSISDAVGKLCDKYFLHEPKTFSIVFNKRYNNAISRDDVIKELADVVTSKNPGNKVNLTEPEMSVIVEVIKGVCCVSVLPEYLKLKKYNLLELAGGGNIPKTAETTSVVGAEAAADDPADTQEKSTAENP
ncbi:THUMP domain-containing protein [Sergentomyia squamirostris]